MDLKVGYHLTDRVRVSVHGGGNVTYRSVASSANFGESSTGSDSNWTLFPNAGADLEIGLTRQISLAARPDITFTTGQEVYMGTLGVTIPMTF